eukprot:TRINITY_DN1896_c0_g5_i1.p1 TRINITY_DN1896_c0_g5~~TRINITY_DN1896_c0_g5_i1.p1  ORF type:complete len:366 (+),score=70.69 TRINITY_DN1896_c0_g5_i1:143-1099(+)
MAVTEALTFGKDGGAPLVLESLRAAPPLRLRRVLRPGGAACAGRRFPLVDLLPCASALDASLALSAERGLCRRPALIFAAHPIAPGRGEGVLSREEGELIRRTNWATGYLDAAACRTLGVPASSSSASEGGVSSASGRKEARPESMKQRSLQPDAGIPECLMAEQVLVLKTVAGRPCERPAELEAAVAFLPQQMPLLSPDGQGYARREDRLAYRRQVEAVLKTCCLLDVDGLCIGCAEGIAGASLFGHPLREAAEVWREVLHDPGLSQGGTPIAAQLRRVVFALAEDVPFSATSTLSVLHEVFADSLAQVDLAHFAKV